MRTSLVTPYVFAAMIVIVLANGGLTQQLGAHPFWSVTVAWVGVPIGLALTFLAKRTRLSWIARSLIFLTCLAAAFAAASLGKQRFAASFAEDALAGQIWYFGWIAVATFTTASIAALLSPTKDQSAG